MESGVTNRDLGSAGLRAARPHSAAALPHAPGELFRPEPWRCATEWQRACHGIRERFYKRIIVDHNSAKHVTVSHVNHVSHVISCQSCQSGYACIYGAQPRSIRIMLGFRQSQPRPGWQIQVELSAKNLWSRKPTFHV